MNKNQRFYAELKALNEIKQDGFVSEEEYNYYKEQIKQLIDVLPNEEYKDYSSVKGSLNDDKIYELIEYLTEEQNEKKISKKIGKLKIADLYHLISEYNWDDGIIIPKMILENKHCDLALAMEIFGLADGWEFLYNHYFKGQQINNEVGEFCIELFNEMGKGRFKKVDNFVGVPYGFKIVLLKKGIVNELTKDFLPYIKK
ncbi:MAG: DUF4274 domain-containing protein [Clostridia bacterium]|nr:DUF4274 domain-containing protein [Clostridia bacterium]